MSANKFTDEFKRDAVAQVRDRGYPVRGVAKLELKRAQSFRFGAIAANIGFGQAEAFGRSAAVAVRALIKPVAVEFGPERRVDHQRGLSVDQRPAQIAH